MMEELAAAAVCNLSIEFTLMHAARCEDVFQTARVHLKPEYFGQPGETHYRIMWRCLLDYYEQHNAMPNYNSLSLRVLNALAADPTAIAEMHHAADKIIEWIYDANINPDSALDSREAMNTLREILVDRAAGQQIRQSVYGAVNGSIPNLPRLLANTTEQLEQFATIGTASRANYESAPASYATAEAPPRPTGVTFMDRFMGGGSQVGDVNVIIGPTGGGKTLLSTQMSVAMAKLQHQIGSRGGESKPGIVAFVSYETGMVEWQKRAAAFAANVHLSRLKFLSDTNMLSTTGNLEDYERRMYAQQGNPEELLGEQERLAKLSLWMNTYLKFIDFSPAATGYGGNGGVPEIRQHLLSLQQATGMPIYSVIIDWAGVMAENYLLATRKSGVEGGALSLELGALVGRLHQEITGPFNCTAWLAHQLKGAYCSRSPMTVPTHSEAQWCTSFAQRAWFAFCIGTKDEEHSVCQLAVTKTRSGEAMPPIICKIDGAFGQLRDVSDQFVPDGMSGRLSPKGDAARVHTGLTSAPSRTLHIDSDLNVE